MKYQSHGRDGAQSSSSATASTSPEQANQRLLEQLQQQHRDTTGTYPASKTPREAMPVTDTDDGHPSRFPADWIV